LRHDDECEKQSISTESDMEIFDDLQEVELKIILRNNLKKH
jgi:hypothetical protein